MTTTEKQELLKEARSASCLVAEVIGNSPLGFDNAIHNAIDVLVRQGVTPTGVDVVGQKMSLNKAHTVTNFRVVLKVSYDGEL